MTSLRCVASLMWMLLPAVAAAQAESAIRSGGDMQLSGPVNPTASRVFIVQLRTPSAGEMYAAIQKPAAPIVKPGTARPRLQKSSAPIRAHVAKLEAEQQSVLAKAGAGTRQIYSYKYGLNGFAAYMSVTQAEKLRGHPQVLNVWEDEIRPLATTHSPGFLGLFDAEAGLRTNQELDGEGLIIGVIDSGISSEHPALQDTREADRPRICRSNWAESTLLGQWLCRRYDKLPDVVAFEELEGWNGECEPGEQFAASDCNNKVIGARWYIDGAENTGPIDSGEFRSPRDADGHGTHTATTAAGNRSNASIFGTFIGAIEGMAPAARIAVYKACWLRPGDSRASCNTSDLANAIDAAVADGVDVINYSVGSSMREVTAPDDIALLAAAKAGVISVVAAGNEGPNLATIGSPAGGPWVITAAASSRDGDSSEDGFEIDAPPSIAGRYAIRESLFSPPLSDSDPIKASLILADDDDESRPDGQPGVTSDGCQPLVNGDQVSGNIVLLQRSGCLFTEMVKNAEDAGAIAALVYNIAGDPVVMHGESGIVDIPALMIGQADANLILAEMDANEAVTVTLEKSLLLTTIEPGNQMASFSARGPAPVGDVLKPDVTAPGIRILAGFTPDAANAMSGENYAYLSGTSMSTPHVAGVATLLRQAHPEWSPAALKSALMTTARQNLTIPDSISAANPFDFGAGHIVPNDAIDPGLVYDISNDEYDAFLDGSVAPYQLNLPSIAVSSLASTETITRRVSNAGEESQSYSVSVSAPPGIVVEVDPGTISAAPGQTAIYDVTFTYASGPLDLWRFGSLTWSSNDHDVFSTIAVKPTSISAPDEVTSTGGTGTLTFPVEFGYNGSYVPRVHGLNLPFIEQGIVANDPTKTFTRRTTDGVTEHVLIVSPNQLFLRFSLFDALTDGADDLDMYVYYCGPAGASCNRIGESGSQTSQEQFNLFRPAAGVYGVYVHGFETDESNGPGAAYSLLAWSIGEIDDKGNMSASGPAFVSAGTTADVTIDWSGLLPNTIYLGGISHNTPQGVSDLTIVTIGN